MIDNGETHMNILVPVDGSDPSLRAVEQVIRQYQGATQKPGVHLINVQPSLPGTIRGVAELARQFHEEEGAKTLARARKLLDDAKVSYHTHISVGDVGRAVADAVVQHQCDMVVMGSRGMGSVANMVLGSAANKVLHQVQVPVLLVK
jgi:nucleotide-binding universal stress UspA family protein